jgi:predicted dehydrogenase/threonine dehydrogenase-like Zn-dependent dehydrogenase
MQQLTQKLKDGAMCVHEVPVPALGSGTVLVRNLYSLVSAGTEGSTVKAARSSLIDKARQRPQQVKQVLEVVKSQGPVQAYRAVMKKLDAYSPLGYSACGKVIGIGYRVQGFEVGDLVACAGVGFANHAEVVSVPENLCVKLHPGTDLRQAAYNTLGAIAMQGVRQADLRLGEICAVIGLGLLGQLTCLLLRASGVRVLGVDIDPAMVEIAGKHCAYVALGRNAEGIEGVVQDFTGGVGCDAVIITAATDSSDPINFAGAVSRKRGTVVVVGAVPTGFEREPHYYRKELQVKMSCSYGPGRYDPTYEEKGIDYPIAYVRWTEKRNMEAFQELIYTKKIDVSYLTTHTFKLEDAPKAYDMMLAKSEPFIGILIEYEASKTIENKPIFLGAKDQELLAADGRRQAQTRDELATPVKSASHLTGQTDPHGFASLNGLEPPPKEDLKGHLQTFSSAGSAEEKLSAALRQTLGSTLSEALLKHDADLAKSGAPQVQRSAGFIGVGFFGAGSYAQSHILPNIPKGNGVTLKGVMTATGIGSRSVGERFGFEFCTGSEKDILENPEINTVFIATRHDSHADYVLKALKAGKNVFVEKPLCLTLQQLTEIAEVPVHGARCTAPSTPRPLEPSAPGTLSSTPSAPRPLGPLDPPLLMVGYNRRFSPFAQTIKETIGSGPMAMTCRVNAGAIPKESWMQDPDFGGGRVIGEVCHFVDLLTYINGSLPVSVFATVLNDPNHLNDTLNVSITYANGSIGTISYFANGDKSLSKERVEVFTHGCTVVLEDFKRLTIHSKGKVKERKLLSQDKGQQNEVRLFLDAVREGKGPPIPYDELFSTSLATFKILESIQTGQSVKLF